MQKDQIQELDVVRIIPCLDVKKGRVVKGVHFADLKDAGDPIDSARRYAEDGADELVFLDISATQERRQTTVELVRNVAAAIDIPLTVGGGIRTLPDIEALLAAGAAKVSIGSAAIRDPNLVSEAAKRFGSTTIICAIDARFENGQRSMQDHQQDERPNGWYRVYSSGGSVATELDVVDWAKNVYSMGAGEILLTSMDRDGARNGYDNRLNRLVSDAVPIPVTASGGAGCLQDFYDAVVEGGCRAVLAASLFHFAVVRIPELKAFLRERGVPTSV